MAEPINGHRSHFNLLATTTPKLLISTGSRQALTIVNGTSGDIYLGYSGTLTSVGIVLATKQAFHDLFSQDEWWVATSSGSGTVSGYSVT